MSYLNEAGIPVIKDLCDESYSPVIEEAASGSIAHFTDGANLPVSELIVGIEPVQSGSGDPSPTNVRPISGRSSIKITQTGKNLLSYPYYDGASKSSNGITFTANSDGTIRATGTATGTAIFYLRGSSESWDFPSGSYMLSGCPDGGGSNVYKVDMVYTGSISAGIDYGNGATITKTNSDVVSQVRIVIYSGQSIDLLFKPVLTLASEYDRQTISLGCTVYGGQLNVTTGVLTVDRKLITVSDYTWTINTSSSKTYARLSLSDRMATPTVGMTDYPLIASMLLYGGVPSGVATWESGHIYQNTANNNIFIYDSAVTTLEDFEAKYADMQIAYYLATPLTYTLTATEIETLLGENNIFADSGDIVSVTYKADTKKYIDNKFAELQALILES